jgi:hypothetical protein
VDGRKEPHVSTSIVRRLKLAQDAAEQAAVDPTLASWLQAIKTAYGDDWDPGSVLARRLRAVRYAEAFLNDVRESGTDALPTSFPWVRDLLATHCDPAFAELTPEQTLDLLKPQRGPDGPAGLIARWTLATGAFGTSEGGDLNAEAKRFRGAVRDARRPDHRARAR